MDEYIKKSYAVDAVLDVYYDTPDIDLSGGKFEAAILKIPPADVAPVRHGRWAWDTEDIYRCSNCAEKSHVKEVMGHPEWAYCPSCGCRMDLEG